MLTIIMTSERVGRWVRMRRFLARFSEPGSSSHTRSLADFITTTPVSRFSVHTGPPPPQIEPAWIKAAVLPMDEDPTRLNPNDPSSKRSATGPANPRRERKYQPGIVGRRRSNIIYPFFDSAALSVPNNIGAAVEHNGLAFGVADCLVRQHEGRADPACASNHRDPICGPASVESLSQPRNLLSFNRTAKNRDPQVLLTSRDLRRPDLHV